MGDTGIIVRFPGTLDPSAEEFTPTTTTNHHISFAVGVPYPHYPTPAADFTSPSHLSPSPTRSLLLSPVPLTTESSLRRDLEVFGDVRAVQMEALRYGIVTVHFYDLRQAQTAFTAIRTHHMHHYAPFFNNPFSPPPPPGLVAGQPIWAHYVLPSASNAFPDAHNQGTLVVFNLDPHVSPLHLQQLFEPFGPIKEMRDTPWKKNQRFVEFFDTRDAAKALKQMNGKEIHGKHVVIEFSRPGGGPNRKFFSPVTKKPFINDLNDIHPPPPPRRRFASYSSSQPQLSHRKSRGSSNIKLGNSRSVLAESMGSMSLSDEVGNGVEEEQQQQQQHSQSYGPSPRRNFLRKQSSETTAVETTKQQLPRSRHWKGKQAKKHETRFLIKEDAIVESSSRDSRTTVMIKNIPNKYSQKLLLNMLDNHCIHCNEQIGDGDDQPLSSYDFVYLPIDFNNKCNVGYGFVNMTSPEATLRLYKAFHLQHWEVFNSRKICEVTYARVQGLEALKEHFKNSKFPCEMEHYLPVVFSPPRDGRELTEPLPIVGNNNNKHHQTSTGSDEMEGGDRVVVGGASSASDDSHSSKSGGVGGDDDDTGELQEVGGGRGLHQLNLTITSDFTEV